MKGPVAGLAWLLLGPLLLAHCAHSSELRGQLAGLERVVEQAERNGAKRCAPRELAIARSQLEFARIELDQGFASKARAHLAQAEPNARAANFLTPAEYCAKPSFGAAAAGDRDADGLREPQDKCPSQAENYNGFRDDDGCPEPDNDLDGRVDAADQCPSDPEDLDGYADEDGCPDLDNDRDTVPDAQDQCPNELGSTTEEPLGCPGKDAATLSDREMKLTEPIPFDPKPAPP